MTPITVRPAAAEDMAAVFALVEELAVYERAGHEVATTPEAYREHLAAGWFDCLVAVEQVGRQPPGIVGTMIYYRAYSTWKGPMLYLEDFVVAEAARRRGVGAALWGELVARARAARCSSVKWQVLDWNEPAKAFYAAVGAELEGGWENGRLWL